MSDAFDVDERAERGAYNQALFREVNFDAITTGPEWVCECASPGCMQRPVFSTTQWPG